MKTVLFTLTFCFGCTLYAQKAGTPDTSFNKTGIKIFDVVLNMGDASHVIAEQPDGKVLVAGAANIGGDQKAFLARFHPNGTFDSSFHFDGIVTIDMSNENFDKFIDIAIRPNGNILVAGETVLSGNLNIMVTEFRPDGSENPNFGILGFTRMDLGEDANEVVKGLHLYDNGKCLVYGMVMGANNLQYSFVLKLNEAGIPDNLFGITGIYKWDENEACSLEDLVVLPTGKIILAGYEIISGDGRATLVGLNENGTLDVAFGTGGKAGPALTLDQEDGFMCIQLSKDKTKLIAAGLTMGPSDNMLIASFSLSGGMNIDFGNGGFTEIDLSIGGDEFVNDMAIQPDGKILLAGNSNNESAVVRLSEKGEMDTDFNTTGSWTKDISPANTETIESIKTDHKGRIIITGYVAKAGQYLPVVARLYSDFGDPTFIRSDIEQVLNVYPNPANSSFAVQLKENGNYAYEITDIQGKVITSGEVRGLENENLQINCASWTKGTYIIRLKHEENYSHSLIIKN